MVENRVEVHLVQVSLEACSYRQSAKPIDRIDLEFAIEMRLGDPIACAKGEFLSDQLVEGKDKRLFLELERFGEGGGRIGIGHTRRAIRERPDQPIAARAKPFGVHSEISGAAENVIESE